MSASMRCARIPGVLCALLFLFSTRVLADADAVQGDRAEAVQWTLVDFTQRPQLAVFHDGAQDHLVAVGHPLPGTTIRLDALASGAAVLVLVMPHGQQLRVTLKRGEAFDPERTLRDVSTALQGAYPPLDPAQDGHDVD